MNHEVRYEKLNARQEAARRRLEFAHEYALANGGECLTTQPVPERAKITLTCPIATHPPFAKRIDAIKEAAKIGKNCCPVCGIKAGAISRVKHSKESLDTYASIREGWCLSPKYLGWDVGHIWQCKHRHRPWMAKPRMVIGMKSWCPECAGNAKYTVEELTEKVQLRGGRCLELSYNQAKERSTAVWQCHFGHTWSARTDTVLGRGDWCPHCRTSYGERLARQILEKLFAEKFPKVRPKWLIGEKRMPLEVDMYNESLFCAEYQGIHHYQHTGYTHDSLGQIKRRDKIKAERFNKMKKKLLIIPEFSNMEEPDQCVVHIKQLLKKSDIAFVDKQIIIDYSLVYINTEGVEFFARLKDYVAQHGGSLLKNLYIGKSKNYQITCGYHHKFYLNEYDMRRNKWCKECEDHKRYLKYQQIVLDKKGIMKSQRYSGSYMPLDIECQKGHQLSLTPHQLAHGAWCKECRGISPTHLAKSSPNLGVQSRSSRRN